MYFANSLTSAGVRYMHKTITKHELISNVLLANIIALLFCAHLSIIQLFSRIRFFLSTKTQNKTQIRRFLIEFPAMEIVFVLFCCVVTSFSKNVGIHITMFFDDTQQQCKTNTSMDRFRVNAMYFDQGGFEFDRFAQRASESDR